MTAKIKKHSNREIFEELPVPKAIMTMAIPMIISQLITLIYNIADTFFIGRVNNPLMVSATSLVFPVFSMSVPVAIISGTGGGTLVSRLMGVKRDDEAKKVASFTAYVAMGLGVIYSLLILIFMNPLISLLGATADNFLYTKQYMFCICVAGGIPVILDSTFSNLLRSVGYSKEAGFGIAMGGVLNIILDPLFIFVILPEGCEVIGAGLATALSNYVSLIYFIITISKLKKVTPLGFSLKNGLPEKKHIKEIFIVGLPSATTTLLFDVNNLILNKLMSAYGEVAVAAIGITIKVERFSLNTCIGLCMGMTPIIGYNYAAKNYKRMKESLKFTTKTGIIISLASIALYEIFAPNLFSLFIKDVQTIAFGSVFLRERAPASLFMFLAFVLIHFFQGIGSAKHTFWLAFIRYAVLCIPALFILNALFGMYGLPMAQTAGDIATDIISWIIFAAFIKKLSN